MKKIIYLVLFLFLASCGSDNTPGLSAGSSQGVGVSSARGAAESILSGVEKGRYVEGELLVKFKPGVAAASSSKANQAAGAASIRRFSLVPELEHVKLPAGLSVQDAIKQYMSDPNVEYAEPNYLKRATMMPNDPLFPQQWGLPVISAPAAWDITTGSKNVVVAVLDTGIDSTHPDFLAPDNSSNIVQGYNFITKSTDTTDDNGHGTHVSGIIGAVGNNSVGIAGLMWGVQIMPLKFLGSDGTGSTSDEILAIDFAVSHGAKIINASFAGAGFDRSEYDAIAQANSAGVLLMAAAGNGSGQFCSNLPGTNIDSSPCYPASFSSPNDPNLVANNLAALPNIISVASTDQDDNLASSSNFGPNSVQVAAPGINILSTVPLSLTSPFCDGPPPGYTSGYEFCSGTSMATPHVSGLAGLIYSQNPGLSYSQVRNVILSSVDPLSSLSGKIQTGGRIDVLSALTYPVGPKISVSPSSNDFGNINVGSSSSKTFTVSNSGTSSLIIGQVTLTGANADEFRVANDGCSGQSVSPLSNCTIQAQFSPKSSGAKSAAISIPSNDTTSPTVTVSLSGTGVSPSPSGGGGGGCSIGGREDAPTAVADSLLILMPILLIAYVRCRRKLRRKP